MRVVRFKDYLKEDGEAPGLSPTNSVGSGAIAGTGVGPKGEPGFKANNKPIIVKHMTNNPVNENETFAGHKTFIVDGERFHSTRLGKRKSHRYSKYVGDDETGEEIRQYGRRNPGSPIILQHKDTGALLYLRYPKGQHYSGKQ